MNNSGPVLLVILFVVIMFVAQIYYTNYTTQNFQRQIERHLLKDHLYLITAERYDPSSSKNPSIKFKVTFRDQYNIRYQTLCHIDSTTRDLFWSKSPLELVLVGQGKGAAEPDKPVISTKELLEMLDSSFRYERLAGLDQISLPRPEFDIIERLADLAATDDDPDVRHKAKELLRQIE